MGGVEPLLMMLLACCFTDSLSLDADRHRRVVALDALVQVDVGRAGIPSAEAVSEIPSVPVATPVRAPAPSARNVCYLHSHVSVVCMYVSDCTVRCSAFSLCITES